MVITSIRDDEIILEREKKKKTMTEKNKGVTQAIVKV